MIIVKFIFNLKDTIFIFVIFFNKIILYGQLRKKYFSKIYNEKQVRKIIYRYTAVICLARDLPLG